jgi:hypothetical protein
MKRIGSRSVIQCSGPRIRIRFKMSRIRNTGILCGLIFSILRKPLEFTKINIQVFSLLSKLKGFESLKSLKIKNVKFVIAKNVFQWD